MIDADAQAILQEVREQQPSMVHLLREMVKAESPTDRPETQGAVFDLVEQALQPLEWDIMRLPGYETGGQLYARPDRVDRTRPVQLLLGHVDTVWPVDTLDEMPLELRDGLLYGPGVYDMKGGIVQMIYALRALSSLGREPMVTPVIFLNSDEEFGSFESKHRIRRLARVAGRTYVLEPSLGPHGKIKTARKGVGRFTVSITGKSSHAGLDPEGGASAIVELSHVVQRLHALNDPERGLSVNVGTIQGGERPNVIAAASRAVVDVRVCTQEDARAIEEEIGRLEPSTPGVALNIVGGIGRPPMEHTPRNRALWRVAKTAGRKLGLELEEAMAGGGSDGNEASLYSATLDGLGPVGDGAHAEHEHIDVEKLIERTALLALLLMADPLPPLEEEAVSNHVQEEA